MWLDLCVCRQAGEWVDDRSKDWQDFKFSQQPLQIIANNLMVDLSTKLQGTISKKNLHPEPIFVRTYNIYG